MKRPTIKELQEENQRLQDMCADKNSKLNSLTADNRKMVGEISDHRTRADNAERQLQHTINSINTIIGVSIPELTQPQQFGADIELLKKENSLFRILDYIRYVASDGITSGINYDSFR